MAMIPFLISMLLSLPISSTALDAEVYSDCYVITNDIHINTDTIEFKDNQDVYTIVRHWNHGRLLQLDVDRRDSGVDLDFVIWDADAKPGLDAIKFYDVETKDYLSMSLGASIDQEGIVNFQIQIEEVLFPGYDDQSGVTPIKLVPLENVRRQPIWKR